jgi:hypothetical protein
MSERSLAGGDDDLLADSVDDLGALASLFDRHEDVWR